MENKLIVPGLEEHEGIIKKQHQEDFIDLDAVCYYSNIPLSELCSPEIKYQKYQKEKIGVRNVPIRNKK